MDRLEHYWVFAKVKAGERGYTYLWEHEWRKHGTCSGLGQYDYFNLALDCVLKTPNIVSENYGGSVLKGDLVNAYGGPSMAAIVCDWFGNNFLSEVRVCFSREVDGAPTNRTECPKCVLVGSNCEDVISIGKFYGEAGENRKFVRGVDNSVSEVGITGEIGEDRPQIMS